MIWPVKDAFANNCEATPALVLQSLMHHPVSMIYIGLFAFPFKGFKFRLHATPMKDKNPAGFAKA